MVKRNQSIVKASEIPSQTIRMTRSKLKSIQVSVFNFWIYFPLLNSSMHKTNAIHIAKWCNLQAKNVPSKTQDELNNDNSPQNKKKQDLVAIPTKRTEKKVVCNLKPCQVIVEKIDVSKYRDIPVKGADLQPYTVSVFDFWICFLF